MGLVGFSRRKAALFRRDTVLLTPDATQLGDFPAQLGHVAYGACVILVVSFIEIPRITAQIWPRTFIGPQNIPLHRAKSSRHGVLPSVRLLDK
jgi:hypothetical protein